MSASYEKRTWWSRHKLTERLADDAFLEAAVTSAFLVAAADGSQSDTEYDALLAMVKEMGIGQDRLLHVAQSLFHDHVPAKEAGLAPVWIDLPARLRAGATTFLEAGGELAYFGDPAAASPAAGHRLFDALAEMIAVSLLERRAGAR